MGTIFEAGGSLFFPGGGFLLRQVEINLPAFFIQRYIDKNLDRVLDR